MLKIKRSYWFLLREVASFQSHFLNFLPGKFGIGTRQKYYKKSLKKYNNDLIVEQNVRIQSPENLIVGSNVHIAADAYLNASGGIEIGSDVYIGPKTKIWTDNHGYKDPTKLVVEQGFEYKPVSIGNDVWIGSRVFIKPGITVLSGAILKSGTILAKNVPHFAILEGNPGRIIGWRKDPHH